MKLNWENPAWEDHMAKAESGDDSVVNALLALNYMLVDLVTELSELRTAMQSEVVEIDVG